MKAIEKKIFLFIIGLLLSIPAVYFIFISVMKYALGWNYPLMQLTGIGTAGHQGIPGLEY